VLAESMEEAVNLESSENIHILLMDSMGPLDKIINELPVKLVMNFPTMNDDDEISFEISLINPDGRLTSKFTGFLDIWEKDFAPQLPIRDIKGEWKIRINIKGTVNKIQDYTLIL
jgi:hypothetical protein